MSDLFRQIIPAQKILNILGDPDQFVSWLQKHHSDQEPLLLFEGYKFALRTCINSIIDGICNDTLLGLENDFLFERCLAELIPLHKISSPCEKVDLLRSIKPTIRNIIKSSTYNELKISMNQLEDLLLHKIALLSTQHIELTDTVSFKKEQAEYWLCLDFSHTFLHQIKGNEPVGNWTNPISTEHFEKDQLNHFLQGYKYAMQFCWYNLLGTELFNQTHLTQLHLADSWREYNYNEEQDPSDFASILNRTFELEEQTCLDSFFYHIKSEITEPIEQEFQVPPYKIHNYFGINKNTYNKKKLFGNLIDHRMKTEPSLTKEERFRECLYWYPLTAIKDGTTMTQYGPASFNTLLAGTAALHNEQESTLPKVVVAKFTHPHKKDENSYSFGVLIDGGSTASEHSYGWIIYHNLSWDYSGFAYFQYQTTMKLINRLLEEEKIDLREMVLPLSEFEVLVGKEMLQQSETNLYDQNKQLTVSLKESNSFLFEVLTAYLCSKIFPGHDIQMNTNKKDPTGEIDIKIESNERLILAECKLNPNNYSVKEMIYKLSKKLDISGKPSQQKSMEFWFWEYPSAQNRKVLEETLINGERCVYHVLSDPNWKYAKLVPRKALLPILKSK